MKSKEENESASVIKKLFFQIEEKEKLAAELIVANKELAFQNSEKEKRAAELLIANMKLVFENQEKEKRAAELLIANKELAFQNEEKHKRAEELQIAIKELEFLNTEQQRLFAAIVNSSDDAMFTKTLDGIITSWNYGAQKIFGYSADEIIGKHVFTLMPPRLQNEEVDIIRKIRKGEKIDNYETERLKKDGTIFKASLSVSPIRDFDGNIIGASKILRDITARTNAARKLDVEERRFRALIENNFDIISLNDDALNLIYRSPSSTRITGWTDEDMKDITGTINIHPDDRQFVKGVISEAMKNPGEPFSYIFRYLHKNGDYIWLEGTATKIPPNDHVNGLVFNSRDITQRIKSEIALKEKDLALTETQRIAKIGSWTYYVNGDLKWSEEIYQLYGLNDKSTPPTPDLFFKIIHPEDREEMNNWVQRCLEGETPGEHEFRAILPDSSLRYFLATGETKYDPDHKPVYLRGSVQDITDRKKAEEEIKNTENKFRALIQNSTDGLNVIAADGTVLDMSPSGKKILGYDQNEIIGKNRSDLIHPEDRRAVMNAFNNIIKDPATIKIIEYRHKMPDETYKWLECSYKNLLNEPYIKAIVSNYRDITERKKYEKKIHQSEIRLLKAQEIGKFGYWQQDLQTDMVWASKEAMNIYGLGEEEGELEREKIASCIIDIEKVKEAATNLIEYDKAYNIEIRINPANGLPMKYISVVAELEKNENGEPARIIGTLQDVTERKKAEIEILLSEEKYRNLFEKSPMPMWIFDVDGLHFLEVNTAAIEQYGFTRAEFLRMTLEDVRPKDKNTELPELKNTNYRIRYDNYSIHKRKDGSLIKVQVSVSSIYFENKSARLALLIDKTDQEKAKDDLIAKTKQLRELAAHLQSIRENERKRIAREIHDELGQQLTAIKMDTVWIYKHLADETLKIKNKLDNIIELLDGSHESVRKILNELRPAILDDNGLLEALRWQGKQFFESTGIPVYFSSNQSNITFLPKEHATCIFRVYQESLTNIMRYAAAGKVVSSLNTVNDGIILTIKDDGKGFDTSKTESKNRFGLLGMEERVLALNGTFNLLSSPEHGTQIEMSLPYKNIS